MESLTTEKSEIKPNFKAEEIDLLKQYFEFNEKYYWKVNEELSTELKKHPLWGPILSMQTEEQQRQQNEHSLEMQRAAIYDGKWDEYTQDLINQGITYARMHVKYADWYEVIKIYKEYLTPYIKKDFANDNEKMMNVYAGLNILIDYAMYTLAEAYFREKNETLNTFKHFFENSYDLACIANTDGYFDMLNPAFVRVLGYTREELLSQPFFNFIHPDDIAATGKEVEKLAAGAVTINFTNRYRKKNGDYLLFAWNATPDTTTGKLYCMARDITEQRIAEDKIKEFNATLEQKVEERTHQLESVNKELEGFSYSVSHDLRAPLRAVNGFAQILEEDYGAELNEEANKLIKYIKKNGTRMGQLIDDLLNFSRLGRKELTLDMVHLDNLVEGVCVDLKEMEPNRTIDFSINELPEANCDSNLIKQVWFNLIGNAVKYTKTREKAIIEIGSETSGGEVVYYVKDNGVGFDMRFSNKLFGVFQRLHSQDEFEGTGVGLAIVQRIVSRHGGRIWAESKLNEGATFYFTLKPL